MLSDNIFVTEVTLYLTHLENQLTLFTIFGDPTTNFNFLSRQYKFVYRIFVFVFLYLDGNGFFKQNYGNACAEIEWIGAD
jgi:hypothetical protein